MRSRTLIIKNPKVLGFEDATSTSSMDFNSNNPVGQRIDNKELQTYTNPAIGHGMFEKEKEFLVTHLSI